MDINMILFTQRDPIPIPFQNSFSHRVSGVGSPMIFAAVLTKRNI